MPKTVVSAGFSQAVFFALALVLAFSAFSTASTISTSGNDGIAVYSASATSNQPSVRNWSNTNKNFSSASVQTTHSSAIYWTRLVSNFKRSEFLFGTLTSGVLRVHGRVFNSTGWATPNQLTTAAFSSSERGFDLAFEDLSGNALLVYESHNGTDTKFGFITWNGSSWSAAQNYTMAGAASARVRWLRAVPRPGSNDIMVIMLDSSAAGNVFAVMWNGTTFDNLTTLLITNAETTSSEEFDFAWEGASGNGLFVYGVSPNAQDYVYRTFNYATKTWGGETTLLDLSGSIAPRFVRTCGSPNSNYVGIIFYDSSTNVNARMWNGSAIMSNLTPTQATLTESDTRARSVHCQWNASGDYAMFVFAARNELRFKYFNFTNSTQNFSVTSLVNSLSGTNFTSGGIRKLDLVASPTTGEMMAIAIDAGSDVRAIRWNITAWQALPAGNIPLEGTAACGSTTFCASFDWYRYDAPPVLTNFTGNGTSYLGNITVNFTVNASDADATRVHSVIARISIPNGTVENITFADENSDGIYNKSFTSTSMPGTYNITVIANDTSTHNLSSSVSGNFTIGDLNAPNVTFLSPSAGAQYNQSNFFNITVNAVDNTYVASVTANVTMSNGYVQQITLAKWDGNVTFSFNWTNTTAIGGYNITAIATDVSGNVNSSVTRSFGVGDATPPLVSNLTPANGTHYDLSANATISATVTDAASNVSAVFANLTLPDNSSTQVTMLDSDSDGVYQGYYAPSAIGNYTARIIANDAYGNANNTEFLYFTAGDLDYPQVSLNWPANGFNTSSNSETFNFTASDGYSSMLSCSIPIDGSVNQTNSSTLNNTLTAFQIVGFANGTHYWNVSCTDAGSHTNTSETRWFIVDQIKPFFQSLNYSPTSPSQLYPGATITVSANVTDNLTGVSAVILYYKHANNATFYSSTMALNASTGYYETTFVAAYAGTYTMLLFANDTVGNSDYSNSVIFAVAYNATWTRIPVTLDAVGTTINTNVALGTIKINNTGFYNLNFTIASDFTNTTFNETFPLLVSNGTLREIGINATSPGVVGITLITFNVTASSNEITPIPLFSVSNVSLVVSEDAFLAATMTSYPTEVKRSDNGVSFEAKVQNVGQSNASNVTLYYTLPPGWVLTFGDLNTTFDSLAAGESGTSLIQVSIPGTVDLGVANVSINATGFNSTGTSLVALGKVSGHTVSVVVSEAVQPIGGGGSSPVEVPVLPPVGGSAATVTPPSPPQFKIDYGGSEFINSVDRISLLRGNELFFPLQVTNVFNGFVLNNLTLETDGYLSQYLTFTPNAINGLAFNQSKSFNIRIVAPAYLSKREYELVFYIKGQAVSEQSYTNGEGQAHVVTTVKDFVEKRVVTLVLHEVGEQEALTARLDAMDAVDQMSKAGFKIEKTTALLGELQKAFEDGDFEKTQELSKLILQLKQSAFDARAAIMNLQKKVADAEASGINMTETKRLLALAESALAREDYITAQQRASDAANVQLLQTIGAFNTLVFVQRNWWQLVLVFLAFIGILVFVYKKTELERVSRKLRDLLREEIKIDELILEAQENCFDKRLISLEEYKHELARLENRRQEIERMRGILLTRKLALTSPESSLAQLREERKRIEELMKSLQERYFHKTELGPFDYAQQLEGYRKMLNEADEGIAFAEAKIAARKAGVKGVRSKIGMFIDWILDFLGVRK